MIISDAPVLTLAIMTTPIATGVLWCCYYDETLFAGIHHMTIINGHGMMTLATDHANSNGCVLTF
jgi:hypothetical protein